MWMYPNRLVCSVLEEMREGVKALNHFTLFRYKKYMSLLIEESQTHVNNMEAGLSDLSDLRDMRNKKKELQIEIKKLKKERRHLKKEDKEDSGSSRPIRKLLEDIE